MNDRLSRLLNKQNRILLLIVIGFVTLFLSAIIFPYYQKYIDNNWDEFISNKINRIGDEIQNQLKDEQTSLLKFTSKVESKIKAKIQEDSLAPIEFQDVLFKVLNERNDRLFSIEIKDPNNQTIVWCGYKLISNDQNPTVENQFQIVKTNFKTLLIHTSELIINKTKLNLITAKELESNYYVKNEIIKNVSLEEKFTQKFEAKVSIIWDTVYFSIKPELLSNPNSIAIPIKYLDHKTAFYLIVQKPDKDLYLNDLSSSFGNFQKILFLFLLTILIFSLFRDLQSVHSRIIQSISFSLLIWLYRVVLLILDFPAFLLSGNIVNPSIYASRFLSGLVKSPLELFLTSTTLTINLIVITIQLRSYLIEKQNESDLSNKKIKIIYAFISLVFIFISPFVLRGFGATFRSFVFDSTIRFFEPPSLIPNLTYFVMYYSVFVTGISLVLYLIFVSYVFAKTFEIFGFKQFGKNLLITNLLLIIPILIFYLFDKTPQFEPFSISILAITISIFALKSLEEKSVLTFRLIFLVVLSASFFSSIFLNQKNDEQEKEFQKTIAYELLKPRQQLINFAINQTLNQIGTDEELSKLFFIESSIGFSSTDFNFIAYRLWINSILSDEGLNSYLILFDKYGLKIGSFGFGMSEPDYIREYFNPSLVEGLTIFLIRNHTPNDLLGVIPLKFNGSVVGYCGIVIELSQSNFQPSINNTIFKNIKYEKNPLKLIPDAVVYSYQNGQLELLKGDDLPEVRNLDYDLVNEFLSSGQNEFWVNEEFGDNLYRTFYFIYETGNPIRLITISIPKQNLVVVIFNLFKISLVHIIISALILLFGTVALLIKGYKFKLRFKTRLFAGLFIVTLIPIVLLAYFTRNSELLRWKKNLSDELKKDLDIATLSLDKNSSKAQTNFQKLLELSQKLNIDFNIYKNTDLIFSSQNKLFEIGFFNKSLPSKVYNDLIIERKNYTFDFEYISDYKYLVGYKRINNENSNIIISIPTLYRHEQIQKELAQIDTFIFGAYSLTLILIFLFGNLFFERLTKPISELTEATKKVSSGDLTIKLEPKETGEVGDLIEAFNRMISDLEESRKNLARIEREQAWKEMAKQVAHEIKNPLTPMKLSLQHLQYLYRSNRKEFARIFGKVSTTLIEQIETLTKITNEFSHFARMPERTITKCNLEEILKEVIDLFSSQVKIIFESIKNETFLVNADKEELKRVFINLIKNSIQATASEIKIKLYKDANFCFVNIEDNGTGIPEELLSKIFDPNFSTKTEGSGLGLPIVKRILNDIDGTIEIKSEVGKGTIVMISIPQIKEMEE